MCGEAASDAVIARLAGAGHGVVARSELLRAGVTVRQIEHPSRRDGCTRSGAACTRSGTAW